MNFSQFCRVGRVAAGLFGVGVFAAASGCGGFGPGDIAVYRIAAPDPKLSGDCQDDPNHTTTFQNGSTVVMYAVAGDSDDKYYLDIGSNVLAGTVTDDGWSFTGTTTDEQGGGGVTFTSKTTITVTVVDEGDQVSGTFTQVQEQTCSGNGCGAGDSGKCTASTSFVGVMVEEPSINVDPGGGLNP